MEYSSSNSNSNSKLGSEAVRTSTGLTGSPRKWHSDEEVIVVAASRPKKRAGRKKFKETRHPVYRGVRRRNNNKWVCEVREPTAQRRIWLGTYPTPEMAARAHDVAALALRGQFAATLNFADSVWRLPALPSSTDPKELRRAAVEAAEAFRPPVEEVRRSEAEAVAAPPEVEPVNVDEEDFETVQGFIGRMAAGNLMSPAPSWGRSFSWDDDDVESDVEVSLWSYSI